MTALLLLGIGLTMSACYMRCPPHCFDDLPSEALGYAVDDADASPAIAIGESLPEAWWELFGDEQLTAFVEQALSCHPTVQAAQARIEAAQAVADQARALLFPTITETTSAIYNQLSQTALVISNSAPPGSPLIGPGIPFYFVLYSTAFNLNYDLDLWCKNRNSWWAALDQTSAKVADEAMVRLSLGVSVADTYLQLQILYDRRDIATAVVANRQRNVEYIQNRFGQNLENAMALEIAESDLATVQRALLAIDQAIALQEHQLQAYLADGFEVPIAKVSLVRRPIPRVPLPCDLPLHLLSRRPDITAQLWLLESARRQIHVAVAGFYPDFSITGLWGYQTIHAHKWFNPISMYSDIGPAFTLPIFQGGQLRANLRGREVDYDLAIIQYNQLILDAVQETLDGITLVTNSAEQLQKQADIAERQQRNYELSQLRLAHHLDAGVDTVPTELSMLQARDQELGALATNVRAILTLIKALGGGYDLCQ